MEKCYNIDCQYFDKRSEDNCNQIHYVTDCRDYVYPPYRCDNTSCAGYNENKPSRCSIHNGINKHITGCRGYIQYHPTNTIEYNVFDDDKLFIIEEVR